MGSAILEATLTAIDRTVEEVSPNIGDAGAFSSGSWPIGDNARDNFAAAPFSGQSWAAGETEPPESPGESLLREFDALYRKYERRVYRQCLRMVRNPEDAEDLTQEVFFLLFRKAHTFRGEANFTTWLHRLTVNTVLMRLRNRRRWHDAVSSLDIATNSESDVGNVVTLVGTLPAPPASTVEKICLDTAIAKLASGYRQVFLLHDAEGYRHDEIAKMLGISAGTSKSQLHKARFRLRELIESAGSGVRAFPGDSSAGLPNYRLRKNTEK